MSLNVSDLHPVQSSAVSASARALQNTMPVSETESLSLSEIAAKYRNLFVDKTGTSYPELETGALERLGYILEQGNKYSSNIDKLSEVYTDSRTINGTSIDEICREGYVALRFYVKSVADYLQALHTCIEEARAALAALQEIIDTGGVSEYAKTQRAQPYIDKLSVCKTFADETINALVRRHQFNNDTKQWDIIGDTKEMLMTDDDGKSLLKTFEEYSTGSDDLNKLEYLRQTPITYKDSRETGGEAEGMLQVFSSLSLIDRLKFIRYYYKLIIAVGDDRYTVFPNNLETGYPCIPDVESKKDTEATKHLGAMEMFYVGYLTDRDGPINAVSSFFEIKVQALRENLNIQSKSISALNTYLEFINRGLNVLNSSQSGADGKDIKHRIPDGAATALTYLCGGSMYNSYEEDDKKYLVLQSNRKDKSNYCFLIPADESGMRFLIGNNGTDRDGRGNNFCDNYDLDETGVFTATFIDTKDPIDTVEMTNAKAVYHYYNENTNEADKGYVKNFKLPTRIDCANVIPNSVREYEYFYNNDKITTDVISSWTDAFSKKTQFINTAIDTINTDIQVDRSKIDSFDSICSTFRSRAHEAHSNTAANVR